MGTGRPYLLAAFSSNASTPPYAWDDISPYVRETDGMAFITTRGRQDITQKVNTGKGTFLLDNSWLYFEQLNANSPYAPNVLPMVPIQAGYEYPWFPGQFTAGTLRNGITGWTAANATTSWQAPADPFAFGAIRMVATGTSSPTVETANQVVPAAKVGHSVTATCRLRHVSGTGTQGTIKILCFSDSAGTVSTGVLAGTTTTITAKETRLTVTGTIPASTIRLRVQVSASATGMTAGSTWDVSKVVLEYTAMSQMQPELTGYADGWQCDTDLGTDLCTLTVSDGYAVLGVQQMNTPFYGTFLRGLGAAHWYRLGERTQSKGEVRSLRFKDEVTGLYDASVSREALDPASVMAGQLNSFVGDGPLAGVAGSTPMDTDFAFSFVGPSSRDGGCIAMPATFQPVNTSNWTVVFWLRNVNGILPTNGSNGTVTNQSFLPLVINGPFGLPGNTKTTGPRLATVISVFGYLLGYTVDDNGASPGTTYFGSFASRFYLDTAWHMIVIRGVGTTVTGFLDGILDHTATRSGASAISWPATPNPATVTRMGSLASIGSDGNMSWQWEVDEPMVFNTNLSDGDILDMWLTSQEVYPYQTSLARASGVLDAAGWPASLRNLDTSKGVIVNPVLQPFSKANPLNYLQLVEDTEQAMLYMDKPGDVTMYDLDTLTNATDVHNIPQYVFGTGGGSEIPFEKVVTSNNNATLYTQASVSRDSGQSQFVDSSLEARYFIRNTNIGGILLDTDQKAKEVAEWRTALFESPGTKIKQVVINPLLNEATIAAVAAIELGTLVTIRLRPSGIAHAGVSYFEVNATVQSIKNEISRGRVRVTYDLSDVYVGRYMQFGDNFDTYDMAL